MSTWWFEITLQSILDERKITQTELSELTGIRRPTITDLCTMKAKHIPLKNLAAICEALDITDLNELLVLHTE